MIRSRSNRFESIPTHLLWIALVAATGLFIATQPQPLVIFALVAAGLVVLALLTPLAAIIALLVLAPMRTLIATEAQFQLPLDIGQITLVVLLAVYFVVRVARGQGLLKAIWTPLSLSLLIFLFITGLSAFTAVSLTAWLNEWLKWLQIFILVVLAINLIRADQWEWLVFGIVLSGLANALIGIYEFFGGSGALHLLINDRFFRAFGTFGQPNPFGGFMGLLIPIALMAALGYAFRAWKTYAVTKRIFTLAFAHFTFYTLASVVMLIAIGMSWSRGAWLGLAGAVAVMAIALPRHTTRGFVIFALGVGIVGLLWFTGNLPASIIERLNSSTQEFFAFEDVRGIDITPENYAVAERLAHWQAALNMATANPWLGVGFGNYEAAYPSYRLLNWAEPLGHAHNYYLNILAEVGLLGLLGYGKVWLSIITITWRARCHPDNLARFIVVGLLGSWVYLSIHSLFDNLYVNNLFIHLGLMLGILVILYNQTWTFIRLQTNGQYSNEFSHVS